MKKFVLPLLAATLVLVSALLVLSPAQTAEARNPLPHELNPDEPGVICWDAHLDIDTNRDNAQDFTWNVATGPVQDVCISVLQDLTIQAWNNGWTVLDSYCYSYTWSPACKVESP